MMDLNHVSKTFGEKTVVSDVTLPIEKGKMTACIGPNGAGKSTLLEIISRLIPRDSGSVIIDGSEVNSFKQNDLAKRLAFLKQTNNMNVRLTVSELVCFGRFPYTKGRLNANCWDKVNKALTYLNLKELKDQYIDTLSGGQLQRALIAMVLCQDTDYILLDEPLNNLDMTHGVAMMKTLRKLVDDLGKTIITVIHDVNFAATYADNIIAMKDGQLFKSGPTDQVLTKENLDQLFNMDIEIIERNNKKVILYYD